MNKRRIRGESGQAMVEFALVLPLLCLLVFGIIDFGWLIYNKVQVENAAREGARYAAVHLEDNSGWDTEVEDGVKLVTKSFTGSDGVLAHQFLKKEEGTPSFVVTSDYTEAKYVRVNVKKAFKWMTPVGALLKFATGSGSLGGDLDLSSTVDMHIEK